MDDSLIETGAVHAVEALGARAGALITSTHANATYAYDGPTEHSRTGNSSGSTSRSTAPRSKREKSEGRAFASRMAVSNTVLKLLSAGDRAVAAYHEREVPVLAELTGWDTVFE